MRIWVPRTRPTMGAASPRGHSTYAPAPTAMRMRPSVTTLRPRLAMHAPPLDEKSRHHGEREIDDGLAPQAAPIPRHIPEACAELIDAHHAVDRQIRRE